MCLCSAHVYPMLSSESRVQKDTNQELAAVKLPNFAIKMIMICRIWR